MAIPDREKTFSLKTSRDLLHKLEWELAGLKSADNQDLSHLAFAAFNTAITAWHLSDWVWADMSDAQRAELSENWKTPLKGIGDFRARLRQENRSIAICREIATASKHVSVTQSPEPNIATVASAKASQVMNGSDIVVVGESAIVVSTWTLKIIDGGNIDEFIAVVNSALEFWSDFIERRIGK